MVLGIYRFRWRSVLSRKPNGRIRTARSARGGEAQARGPFLNGRMTDANSGPAYDAAQRALSLIDHTDDPKEKALIRAMALRYVPDHDPDMRAPLDSTYSLAMSEIYTSYPGDVDVGTLYAESLMLLNTQRSLYEADDPYVESFHSVLEGVIEQDINQSWCVSSLYPRHRSDIRSMEGRGVCGSPHDVRARFESSEPHAVAHL